MEKYHLLMTLKQILLVFCATIECSLQQKNTYITLLIVFKQTLLIFHR